MDVRRSTSFEFRTLRPDVSLMDLPMPEMNGLDTIIAIRGEFHGGTKNCADHLHWRCPGPAPIKVGAVEL